MKWINLKYNKCPKCDDDFMKGFDLVQSIGGKVFIHKCGFKIRESRYSQIVNSQVSQQLVDKWDMEMEGGEYYDG